MSALWILPLIALFSTFILIYIIYTRAIQSRSGLIWVIMLLFFLLYATGEFAQKWLGEDEAVMRWTALCIIFGDMFPAIFLIFTLLFPTPNATFLRHQKLLLVIILVPKIASTAISLLFGRFDAPENWTEDFHFGYYPIILGLKHQVSDIGDWYFYLGLGHTMVLFFLGAIALMYNYYVNRQALIRDKIRLILIGFALYLILSATTGFIAPLLGYYPPELISLGSLLLNIIVAYGLVQGDLLLFEPTIETTERKEYDDVLRIGDYYLCSKSKGKETFTELVNHGYEGLYIGVVKPDLDITQFKRTPIVILTEAGKGLRQYGNLKYVPADELRTVKSSIFTFVQSASKGVIFLDNMDLILEKDWAPPYEFVEFGTEMRGARIMNVLWLFGTNLKEDDKLERLPDLMQYPLLKKSTILDMMNRVIQAADIPRPEVEAQLDRLGKVEPIFARMQFKDDKLVFDERSQESKRTLTLDSAATVRLFVNQVRGQIPGDALKKFIQDLKRYNISRFEFLLRPGDSYIIEEPFQHRGKAYEIYLDFVDKGFDGICITRTEPSKLKERYLFPPDSRIYWLTQDRKEDLDLKPAPEYLMVHIKSFIDSQRDTPGIILLDGLEYLVTFMGDQFDSYLKVLRRIADLISQSNLILLIPYDPEAISKDRIALFRRSGLEVLTADMLG